MGKVCTSQISLTNHVLRPHCKLLTKIFPFDLWSKKEYFISLLLSFSFLIAGFHMMSLKSKLQNY